MAYNYKKHDYKDFSEFVMCFILSGCKFSEKHYIRYAGFGGEAARIRVKKFNGKTEYNKAKWKQFIGPTGAPWDTFIKEYNDDPASPGFIDEMEGINEICEILQLSRQQMKSKLEFSVSENGNQIDNYWANFENFFSHCTSDAEIKTTYRFQYMQHGHDAFIMAEINNQLKAALFPESQVPAFDLSMFTTNLNAFIPMPIDNF